MTVIIQMIRNEDEITFSYVAYTYQGEFGDTFITDKSLATIFPSEEEARQWQSKNVDLCAKYECTIQEIEL